MRRDVCADWQMFPDQASNPSHSVSEPSWDLKAGILKIFSSALFKFLHTSLQRKKAGVYRVGFYAVWNLGITTKSLCGMFKPCN